MTIVFSLLAVFLGIVSIICLLRFLFQLSRVDPNNRVVNPLVRITDTFLKPLRTALPLGRNIDSASLFVAWLAMAVRYALLYGSPSTALYTLLTSAWGALIQLLQYCIWIYIIAIVAGVIFSWVAPQSTSPYVALARQLPSPLLRPVQQLIPSLGGLDFSPAIVLIALTFMSSNLIPWLHGLVA